MLPVADVFGKADAAAAVPVVTIILGGGHSGIEGIGKGGQQGQQTECPGADRHPGQKPPRMFQVPGPPQAAAGTEAPHRGAGGQQHRKPQPGKGKGLRRVGRDAGEGVVEGIPHVFPVVGGGGEGQAGNVAGKVQHPVPAAGGAHRHIPAAAGELGGVGRVRGGNLDGEQRILGSFPLRGLGIVKDQPLQLQIVQRLVDASEMQRGAVAGQGHAAVVVAGDRLVQVVKQLDGGVVVGGKVLDVAQKNLGPQGTGHQRRRDQCPAPGTPQQSGAAQRADAAGGPGGSSRQGSQPEQTKAGQQPRPAEKEKRPHPDAAEHHPGRGQVPAGRTTPGSPGRQNPARQTQRGAEQQRSKRHSNAPFPKKIQNG